MARIIPHDLTKQFLLSRGDDHPEIRTLGVLKDALPPDYTVFHSIHWSTPYRPGKKFGEVDFVIVSPVGKVLLIEQKNGQLRAGESRRLGFWLGDQCGGARADPHSAVRLNAPLYPPPNVPAAEILTVTGCAPAMAGRPSAKRSERTYHDRRKR